MKGKGSAHDLKSAGVKAGHKARAKAATTPTTCLSGKDQAGKPFKGKRFTYK